jgi:hypothetical protein
MESLKSAMLWGGVGGGGTRQIAVTRLPGPQTAALSLRLSVRFSDHVSCLLRDFLRDEATLCDLSRMRKSLHEDHFLLDGLE